METNVMNNEVLNENVEEVITEAVTKGSNKYLKKTVIGLAIVGGGTLAYKYGVKKIVKHIKDKKATKEAIVRTADGENDISAEITEDITENLN